MDGVRNSGRIQGLPHGRKREVGLLAVEVGPIAFVGEVAHMLGERRLDVEDVDLQAGVFLELADHVAYAVL